MANALPTNSTVAVTAPPRPKAKRKKPRIGLWISVAWCVAIVSAAVLAPWLPIANPDTPDYEHVATGIGVGGHLLGTDQLGRDILSRSIWGAQASLQVGFVAVLMGMTLGMVLGLLAGYYGGKTDAIISILVDIVLAFPSLIFIMVLVAIRGASAGVLIFGLGAIMVPTFTRLARANTLVWAQREFVTAATVLGSKRARTLATEVFPNVLPAVLAYAFVVVAVVMVAEGSLSFLGFGIQPPTASWGSMIAGGRTLMYTSPHIVIVPAMILLLTVLAFNFIGDYLRSRTAGRTDVTL